MVLEDFLGTIFYQCVLFYQCMPQWLCVVPDGAMCHKCNSTMECSHYRDRNCSFASSRSFSESGWRLCFNFCFSPQFAPHWASLESKGGGVLSGLSPWFSLPLQSLLVLTYGWWCLWCCLSSLRWLSSSLSTSALWAIIGALLMAEVRGAVSCYDPLCFPVSVCLLGCSFALNMIWI